MTKVFQISIFFTTLFLFTFILYGYLYNFIEKKTSKYVFSTFGYSGILFTGIIGTTVHELGHLIMCLIFNHRITDFQLFNFKGYKNNEVLGYVSHKYNNKSLYQKSGNFFIGIGPMIFSTLFIIFSFKLLLPDIFSQLNIGEYLINFNYSNTSEILYIIVNILERFFSLIFNINNLKNIKFYIFIYIMFSISNHISLSKKDLENSISGICSLFLIILIGCLSYFLINDNLGNLYMKFLLANIYLILFLSIGLAFSIISFFISFLFSRFKKAL